MELRAMILKYNELIERVNGLRIENSFNAKNKLNCKRFRGEIKNIILNLKYYRDKIIFYSKKNNCAVELKYITYFKGKKFYN